MDLLSVSSARQYAKHMTRKTQWDLKRQSGDWTGHKKSLQDYVNITKASSVLPQTEEQDHKLSAILTKAQVGKKLSPDEWEYLRTKNPMMYEKVKEAEREQESYEEALKRCKTRDEVQRLYVSKLGDIMTAAKNGDGSAIFRLNRLTRSTTEFTKSEEYHALPTEAEEAIERERERVDEQEALREEAEREAEEEPESAEPDEDKSETKADAKPEAVSDTKTGAKAEAMSKTKADMKPEAVAHAKPEAVSGTKAHVKPEAVPKTKAHAAPVLSVGQRAYVDQRESESRAASRRKVIDEKA